MVKLVAVVVLLFWSLNSSAEVRLAHIFGDHMVLQRHQAIPVWGWAHPGEGVRVELNQQQTQARADANGRWSVMLGAEEAGGPYRLRAMGTNSVVIEDVLIGDVWLAGGQSNMEWTVAQSNDPATEIAQSSMPHIRHIKIPKTVAFQMQDDVGLAPWKVSKPENSGEFSAVGYFFARTLHQELGVPIGIVNATWGGTNIETWLSPSAAQTQPDFNMQSMPADAAAYNTRYRARIVDMLTRWQHGLPLDGDPATHWSSIDVIDRAWPTLRTPGYWEEQGLQDLDGVVWYRRSIELTSAQAAAGATLHLGMLDDCDETYVNGASVGNTCGWDTPRRYAVPAGMLRPGKNVIAVRVTDTGGGGGFHGDANAMQLQTASGKLALAGEWKARVESVMRKDQVAPNDLPTLAFNAMIKPIAGFPVKGVIWYQGESNVSRAHHYAQTFPLLISDWRKQWGQPELPFFYVQLASFLPVSKNSAEGSTWAELRDAQLQTLKVPKTGMVVAIDIGDADSIHPLNKQAVGLRLARHALKNAYGHTDMVPSGPLYRSMHIRGRHVEIKFSETGTGLLTMGASAHVQGFLIADRPGHFVPAQARIVGNTVVVHSPQIARPRAVRYGWFDNPQDSNLFNREGLPASPFRTDAWPLLTEGIKFQY